MKTLVPTSIDSPGLRAGLTGARSSALIHLLLAALRSARVDSWFGIHPPQPRGGVR